jgi:thermitase
VHGPPLGGSAQAAGYEPDQVIVKYADGTSPAQRMKVAHRAGVTRSVGSIAGVAASVVRVRRDPAVVAARLNRSRVVEYAEPNLIVRAAWFPNDPRFGELHGLHNAADADIDAPEGWQAAGLGSWPATGGVRSPSSTPGSTKPIPT